MEKMTAFFSDDLAIKQWNLCQRIAPAGHQLLSARFILKKYRFDAQKNEGKYSNWGIYSELIEADIRFIQYRFHSIYKHRNKTPPEKLYIIFKCNLMTTTSTGHL